MEYVRMRYLSRNVEIVFKAMKHWKEKMHGWKVFSCGILSASISPLASFTVGVRDKRKTQWAKRNILYFASNRSLFGLVFFI